MTEERLSDLLNIARVTWLTHARAQEFRELWQDRDALRAELAAIKGELKSLTGALPCPPAHWVTDPKFCPVLAKLMRGDSDAE